MNLRLLLALSLLSTAAAAQDYSTPYGAWRGPTQFQATLGTAVDPSAHTVVPAVIDIDDGGKVRGLATGNGCLFLGLARPGVAPYILNLDVTVSGCEYAAFNRRYSGSLTLFQQRQHATFDLRASTVSAGQASTFDISATMRR